MVQCNKLVCHPRCISKQHSNFSALLLYLIQCLKACPFRVYSCLMPKEGSKEGSTSLTRKNSSNCTFHKEQYTSKGLNDALMEEGNKGSVLLKMRELFVLISGECWYEAAVAARLIERGHATLLQASIRRASLHLLHLYKHSSLSEHSFSIHDFHSLHWARLTTCSVHATKNSEEWIIYI